MSQHSIEPIPPVQHVVVPERPKQHSHLLQQASEASLYLSRLIASNQLNADLRLELNDIKNTILNLRDAVSSMDTQAEDNHNKLVAVIQSQRLHG